jgi:SAM-dependent methyltransferase
MHPSVHDWVASQVEKYDLADKHVLEVGSLDVNGSIRGLFNPNHFIGVDFRPGPGVDFVMNAHNLHDFKAGSFNVVISTEMLEHDDAFWLSMKEMGRVLLKGGHLLITTRGNGFKLHSHPDDYWRFMPSAREKLLDLAKCDPVDLALDARAPGIFAHGVKR